MRQEILLPSIDIGAPFSGTISWTGSGFGATPIPSGTRVMGQFRAAPGSTVLATVDTAAGTLVVSLPQTLQLNMTAAQTTALQPAQSQGYAYIDFRRYDMLDTNGAPFLIPIRVPWPLRAAVTLP